MRFCLALLPAIFLAACGQSTPSGPIGVAVIGESQSLFQQGVRLSSAAQHLRAATHEGLVGMDDSGQIVPGIAERWIVTDDGMSYIFRLRNSDWPDGSPISAAEVRLELLDNLRRLGGTSLGLDLAKIEDIRAMTGRVVEISLSSPMPDFLRLLAQPEMGLIKNGQGAGPMVLERAEGSAEATLTPMSPSSRGLPERESWESQYRSLLLAAMPAEDAVAAFADGKVDLVLNGRIATLPYADTGPLTRGTVRLDAAVGVMGFAIRSKDGILGDAARREALSMAIDRNALMQPFNIGGWQGSLEIVPREFWGDIVPEELEWTDWEMERRLSTARSRIAAYDGDATVSISLPEGPGSDRLFEGVANAFAGIGVTATRAREGEAGDLQFYDRVARFASPRWFLNQFNCSIRSGPCSAEADALVEQSLAVVDMEEKGTLLAQADIALQDEHVFIPLGAPIRWSLVRGSLAGYQENRWGLHPLFPLSQPPI